MHEAAVKLAVNFGFTSSIYALIDPTMSNIAIIPNGG
jgi:hypothetical protein